MGDGWGGPDEPFVVFIKVLLVIVCFVPLIIPIFLQLVNGQPVKFPHVAKGIAGYFYGLLLGLFVDFLILSAAPDRYNDAAIWDGNGTFIFVQVAVFFGCGAFVAMLARCYPTSSLTHAISFAGIPAVIGCELLLLWSFIAGLIDLNMSTFRFLRRDFGFWDDDTKNVSVAAPVVAIAMICVIPLALGFVYCQQQQKKSRGGTIVANASSKLFLASMIAWGVLGFEIVLAYVSAVSLIGRFIHSPASGIAGFHIILLLSPPTVGSVAYYYQSRLPLPDEPNAKPPTFQHLVPSPP